MDADKLRRDGLHLGDLASVVGRISSLALGSEVVIEDATTVVDLNRKLAKHAEARRTFDVVLIIGHSNANGIRLAEDLVVGWPAFAAFLKPFAPRRLLLVACKAGRWDAGEALFQSLPRLRRIYACPVNASKDFGALLLAAVPYVVATRRPRGKHVAWTQAATVALTGRQLREWLRTSDKGNPDSAVFDHFADAIDPIARAVPSVLKSVFDW